MKITFAERIKQGQDKNGNKTPLHANFIDFIREIASINNKHEDAIYDLWRDYVAKCDGYDQSPVKYEFCQWYKLECSENILQLI